MYAVVGSQGAEDAWYAFSTWKGHLDFQKTPYTGGTVDIAKSFDQINRSLVAQPRCQCRNGPRCSQCLPQVPGWNGSAQLGSKRHWKGLSSQNRNTTGLPIFNALYGPPPQAMAHAASQERQKCIFTSR